MISSSAALDYMTRVSATLQMLVSTQMHLISLAADKVAETLRKDGLVYLFGTGHSHLLAEEGHYRAGGLAAACPILVPDLMLHEGAVESTVQERTNGLSEALLAKYAPTSQDVLFIFSNSGVNAVPVEMAMAAKARGMTVIAILSLAYSNSLTPRVHGKKLLDFADITLDNHGPAGDAMIEIIPDALRAGPISTVTGAFLLNAVLVEAMQRIVEGGQTPPVYISANMPGAAEHNAALVERYRRRNPHL
jgi:uncharacterized phosphosugar-binding protein